LRVASTFRLPHLLHRSRFTKPTIGVPGVIARRNNPASVNTPTCRQLRALDGQRRLSTQRPLGHTFKIRRS
jgi:hypothetical protein